jgi:hypothetical protein
MKVNQPSKESETMLKVLIDADLILELFLNRSEFIENAERLFDMRLQYQNIQMYVTDQCLAKIYTYLSIPEIQVGKDAVLSIQEMFDGYVVPITSAHIEEARLSSIKDFDSSVEVACAIKVVCDAIITNHPQNFENSALPIWSIEELELRLKLERILKTKAPILPVTTKKETCVFVIVDIPEEKFTANIQNLLNTTSTNHVIIKIDRVSKKQSSARLQHFTRDIVRDYFITQLVSISGEPFEVNIKDVLKSCSGNCYKVILVIRAISFV